MMSIDLSQVGNFPDYVHGRRFAKPAGHFQVASSALVLKLYHMYKEGEENPKGYKETEDRAKRFIEEEVAGGRIDRLAGLGHVILSEDMLNVAVWGAKDTPYVPLNHLFQFADGFTLPSELDIREWGAFCAWEKGIDSHEAGAWMKYLASKRAHEDKVDYIHNTFIGELWPANSVGKDAGD